MRDLPVPRMRMTVTLAYAVMLGLLASAASPSGARAQERSVPVDTGVTLRVLDMGSSTGE